MKKLIIIIVSLCLLMGCANTKPKGVKISKFKVEGNNAVLEWPSKKREVFCVYKSNNLKTWQIGKDDIKATPPLNIYKEPIENDRGFFKVERK